MPRRMGHKVPRRGMPRRKKPKPSDGNDGAIGLLCCLGVILILMIIGFISKG